MSFSNNIRNEIAKAPNDRSEAIAEISAILRNTCLNKEELFVITESASVARRIFSLIKELYNINVVIDNIKTTSAKKSLYKVIINNKTDLIKKDLCLVDEENNKLYKPKEYLISSEEEKRAYLRGVFLITGSINDPKTANYHLELSIPNKEEANLINNLLNEFNLNSKLIERPNGYMIYIKKAEKISDFLRIINASGAVLYFEDIRIYRDHKNMTNRLNNCEQAIIDKIITTATRQIEDINNILNKVPESLIDEKLKSTMNYRIKYPDVSLQELSEIITIETGKLTTKSCLNHRFRKIKEMASKLK